MHAIRHAIRRLGGTPWFTTTAVLVLALAIAALTTVFSLLWALVLRPLPVPAPHELVLMSTRDGLGREGDLTWREFQDFVVRQRAFSAVIGSIGQGTVTVDTERGSTRSAFAGVTSNFFGELGASPALGRLIGPDDGGPGSQSAAPVAVLSWSYWHRHYSADPTVLGRTLHAEGLTLTIIGIAPPGFLGLGITLEPDVTVPLAIVPRLLEAEDALFRGTSRWVATMGRLAPGVTIEVARAQVTALWPSLRDAAVPAGGADAARAVELTSGARGIERGLRARYTDGLNTLLAIAAAMWLIAALNLCALVGVRLEASRHELGVRLALGASTLALVRDGLLQGTLLGIAGAVGGLQLASYAGRRIADLLLADYLVPTALDVSPGTAGAVLALGVGVGTALLTMAGATWMVTASDLQILLAGGSRSVARSTRLGRMLVAGQAALSMVLVTQASLLARNVQALAARGPGLTVESVLVSSPSPRVGAYRNLDAPAYYRDALTRVRAVPGVDAAAFSQFKPERGALPREPVAGANLPPDSHDALAEGTGISPGFLETLGVALVDGRDFTFDDQDGRPKVVIISQAVARQVFGNVRAVGQRLRLSSRPGWHDVEVVGVATDAVLFDIRGGNRAIVYLPALQTGRAAHYKTLVVRGPAQAARGVQLAIDELGAELLPPMQTLDDARARTLLQERLLAGVGGTLGATALVLVSAGLYGLLSYVLSLNRKDIGIRLALGADRWQLSRSLAATGVGLAAAGAVAGLSAALLASSWLRSVLVAVSPYDPLAIGGAGMLLLTAAALASVMPALRAARVDPLTELRRD